MQKQAYSDKTLENSEEICSEIRERAGRECEALLSRGNKEVFTIYEEAKQEAEKKREELSQDSVLEREKLREKIFSTLNLEKRKITLEERSKFAQTVIAAIKKEAEHFRNNRDYAGFLRKAIIEGSEVLGVDNINVHYSFLDEKLFNENLAGEATEACRAKLNKDVNLKFLRDDYKDIGVWLESQDGRLIYDNRFLSRLQRNYEELYVELLKEGLSIEGVSS
jgi:vacuolar-type H+-ATPase subunit E/Vma4